MATIRRFLTRTRGRGRIDVTDILTYLYFFLGVTLMFGPVLWLVLSSFKTEAVLVQFPPTVLPYAQETVIVEGYDEPLPLFKVISDDGTSRQLAQVRRIGLVAQMVDPDNPGEIIKVNIDQRRKVQSIDLA